MHNNHAPDHLSVITLSAVGRVRPVRARLRPSTVPGIRLSDCLKLGLLGASSILEENQSRRQGKARNESEKARIERDAKSRNENKQ